MSLFERSPLQEQYERNSEFHELVDFLEDKISKDLTVQKLHKLVIEAILFILEQETTIKEKETETVYRKQQQEIEDARQERQGTCQHEWGYLGSHMYGYCMKCLAHQ